MAAIINADDGAISGASGLKLSSDTSGALNIQTNGVTAIAISASQAVSFPATTSLNFTSANITTLTSSSATITNLTATTLTVSAATYLATASGNVGIGTSSATSKLTIGSDTFNSAAANTTGMYTGTNGLVILTDGFNFATRTGSDRLLLNTSGNLGLGGTPSSWQSGRTVLQITPSSTQGHLAFGGVISNISTNAFVDSTPAWKYIANGIPALYQQDEGRHFWYTAASGTAGNTISWTQAMTLTAAGELLVGATSLATGFSTFAQIEASGTTGGVLINSSTNQIGRLMFTNNNAAGNEGLIRYDGSNSSMQFWTAATERARILSDGKFCIGDTSSNYLLRVGGAINNNAKIGGFTIGQSASEYPSAGYNVRFTTTVNTYNYEGSDFAAMIRYAQNDGRIETFTAASGTVGNQITFTTGPYVANLGTSWTNSSDERLKNITGEIQNGLAKVCSLRAAEFTWKTGGTGKQQVGLIAQDVLNVLPEVVVIPDAEFDGTAGTAMGVNYDQTIPLLVAAIKELKSELDQLKGKL